MTRSIWTTAEKGGVHPNSRSCTEVFIFSASATCRMRFYEAFLQVLANRLTMANQRLAAF